jgi:hypothetical protein
MIHLYIYYDESRTRGERKICTKKLTFGLSGEWGPANLRKTHVRPHDAINELG